MKPCKNVLKVAVVALGLSLSISNSFAQQSELSDVIYTSQQHHKIKILTHGLASLQERLHLIASAKQTIDLEYFVFNADESGKIMLQALIKKSQEGVKVRLILDSITSKSEINPHIAARLEKEGIEVRYYNNFSLLKALNFKYRNHRKSLIVDGKVAIIGGRNIGNEYFDLGKHITFFDRDIVVTGDIVKGIETTYEVVWNAKAAEKIVVPSEPQRIVGRNQINNSYRLYHKLEKEAETFLKEEVDARYTDALETIGESERQKSLTTSCDDINFITERPIIKKSVQKQRVINNYLREKIREAKSSVMIETPYFSLNHETEAILDEVIAKNVNVSIVSNGANASDVKVAVAAIDGLLRKWFKRGVHFFLYDSEKLDNYPLSDLLPEKSILAIHAKTYIFDDQDIMIGTHNFDYISAKLNDELMIECKNAPKDFINKVKGDIKGRMKHSMAVTNENFLDELSKNSVLYKAVKMMISLPLLYDRIVN